MTGAPTTVDAKLQNFFNLIDNFSFDTNSTLTKPQQLLEFVRTQLTVDSVDVPEGAVSIGFSGNLDAVGDGVTNRNIALSTADALQDAGLDISV